MQMFISQVTDLTVSGLPVFAVEVGPVAVLVPPGSFVGQGAVSDSDVIVSVFCREGSSLVVAQRVTWVWRRNTAFNISGYPATQAYGRIMARWGDVKDQTGRRERLWRGILSCCRLWIYLSSENYNYKHEGMTGNSGIWSCWQTVR